MEFAKDSFSILNASDEEIEKCDLYFRIPHKTLSQSTFAMGIVTGNNAKFISKEVGKNMVDIISGKGVRKGEIIPKKCFILNTPEKYQQKPDMSLFLKKIVYRFISSEIVSAVDSSGGLTLNSANFIILPENFGLPEEYVSALLNSKVVNDIYAMKNANPLKVLKGALKDLPIFLFDKGARNKIVKNYKLGLHQENEKIILNRVEKLTNKLFSVKK